MMWTFDRFGSQVAVVDEFGQRLSYAELAREGRALCQAVGSRCLVLQVCQNTLGSFLGYASFLEGNIVPAMLGADTNPETLEALYQAYAPKFLWVPEGMRVKKCMPVYKRFGYQLLATPFEDRTQLHADLALLLTTSGSTGSPKFVRQSYRNIRSNTDSIVEYLELTAGERPITTLPMHYTYGLSIINSHLDVGAAILLTDKGIAQKDFWSFFKAREATSFGGVPYTYEMLDRMRFTRMDLPSLKVMTQAGGKLSLALHEKLARWCLETGRKFYVMYGQCEATARMSYLPWTRSLEKAGTIGIAIPGGRFELLDGDGTVITQPEITGELRYHGDNVTLGYAQSAADLVLGDERGGVLDTGDMAKMDADGYFTIVGRQKRFLKIFGNRVNLDEAEGLLKAAFPDVDLVCGGKDDHLYLFATREDLLPELRRYLIEKTGLNPVAFHAKVIPEIPHNDAGKTLYKELEQYYD